MFPVFLTLEAERLLAELRASRLQLATAESCTGGLIASLLTAVPGSSSDVFDRGFIAYSNEAKTSMLRVPEALLQFFGPVSQEVAIAMVDGVMARLPSPWQ